MENNDYSKWTLEALLAEEKKHKKKEIFSATLIGFLIGVLLFGVVKNGFGIIYIAIPLFLIFVIVRDSRSHKQKLKQIQAEIANKNTQ